MIWLEIDKSGLVLVVHDTIPGKDVANEIVECAIDVDFSRYGVVRVINKDPLSLEMHPPTVSDVWQKLRQQDELIQQLVAQTEK